MSYHSHKHKGTYHEFT